MNAFIPHSEFAKRVDHIQAELVRRDLDVLLAFSTESEPAYVRYLSDYWPSFETAAVLIPREGSPLLLIGPESATFAKARSRIDTVVSLRDFRESSQPSYPGCSLPQWPEVLAPYEPRSIAIAGWHLFPHPILEGMKKAVPKATFSNGDDVLRKLMIRKSEAELACLREAARLSEIGLSAVLEKIRPGMTEIQVAGLATAAMLDGGAEATGYPVWCCSGPNSCQAISRPTHRRIGTGEVVQLCVGAKVSGYSASIGRPIILGKAPADLKAFLQTGVDAERLTLELMQCGKVSGEIACAVHDFIRSKGYGDTILYGPAHGCGQMECEYPFLESSSTFFLEPAMTFMVDIFLARGQTGFRWEDGVILHEKGLEVLSSLRREVIEL